MKATLHTVLSLFLASYVSLGALFAQEIGFSYLCPLPGSRNLNPEQNIILKCEERIDILSLHPGSVVIRGSESGEMRAELMFAEDLRTLIFKPVKKFTRGESVHVWIRDGIRTSEGNRLKGVNFEFNIIQHDREEIRERLEQLTQQDIEYKENSITDVASSLINNTLPADFPAPTAFSYGEHDDELIFVNMNCRNPNLPWNLFVTIFDSYGTPVFFDESAQNRINFSPLQNGTLCFATNLVINGEAEKYYILDSACVVIDSVNTGNGYILDAHEMLLLSNGHYLVMSYDPQPVNMSQVVPGGNANAIVTGLVIQEVDNNQNVFFQWRSWDHFDITDATEDIDLTAPAVDYVHGNAFEIDHDGNILLSSRHLDEITKINFNNGDVMWRFGKNSENNMFTVNDDPLGFTHQHDIEVLYNNRYTIFDNGNLRNPSFSRVLEYVLNESTMTAELVWDYNHSPNIYASSAGSFRTQPNGNRIIGWGGTFPEAITELKADNTLLREFHFPSFVVSYRAVKGRWETNIFKTREKLPFGNYDASTGIRKNYLYIYNRSDQVIKISSAHHHRTEFEILTDFPVSIFPHSYTTIMLGFTPDMAGEFTDRLTLNYDNADTSRRIARQLELRGIYAPNTPTVVYNPSFAAQEIDPGTVITATFSEPVKKIFGGDIVNEDIPGLFELKMLNINGEDVSFTGSISDDKTVINIEPQEALYENQQYYIRLNGGVICDYEGNQMTLDEESYFSTGMLTSLDVVHPDAPLLFPNPCKDDLYASGLLRGEKDIRVYSSSGKLVHQLKTSADRVVIDMSGLEAGVYLLNILHKESGATVTYKVIRNAALH